MTARSSIAPAVGVCGPSWWGRHHTALVFGAALVALVVAWVLLAIAYGGLTQRGGSGDVRGVLNAVTSTTATAGPMEARALLATPEYFAVDGRSAAYFGGAPERSLEIQSTAAGYFDAFDRGADALALDPVRNEVVPSGVEV